MKHGSLFSGIGGFELAAQWMDWDNIFHCEWNEFGQKVLKYHFPKSISYADITKTDFSIHRGTIDILTGGFPCQPYSTAGKRLGKEDERHLWPEMLRAIREIEPRWIVGENVLGLVSWNGGMVFEEVCAELEAEGYEVQPYILPAAGVNAPHQRYRVWFVAHFTNTSSIGLWENGSEERLQPSSFGTQFWMDKENWIIADSNDNRTGDGFGQIQGKDGEVSEWNDNAESCNTDKFNVSDTSSERLEGSEWRSSVGNRFMLNDWNKFPTKPPVCNGDDGLSDRLDSITFPKWRNESIKAGGNAIVPQVAHQIFKAIQEYEQHYGSRLQ